jgi:uridylate kinase
MSSLVLSLGGSILAPAEGPDPALARDVAAILERLADDRTVYAVVGGGETARAYIEAARTLGADEASLDEAGIAATRMNARLLAEAVDEAHPTIPAIHEEALVAGQTSPVVVMGGTHAAHTTDAVAAVMAERARAERVVIATDVDGVYTADPREDPDARRRDTLTHEELVDVAFTLEAEAGSSGVVDPLAARILARSGTPAAVVDGSDLEALEAALAGESFPGTLVGAGKE